MKITKSKLTELYNRYYDTKGSNILINGQMHVSCKKSKKIMCFLDELNRAPLDVRQSAMQLVLERQIHEHILPTVDGQRCLIIAACNPADEYQVDELDPALLDRFLFCTADADAPTWLKWARDKGVKGGKGVNQIVRDFIAANQKLIHYVPADGGTGATPRSWTKLGDHLDNFKNVPADLHFQVMKGKIGEHLAGQFYTFYNNYVDVVKMSDIEKIVEKNKDKYSKIEDIAEKIAKRIKKQEAVQKTELAHQFKDKYTAEGAPDMLPMLAYLYAMEVEICVAFLKGFRKDDPEGYKSLVDIDARLNDKTIFKRIIQSSEKSD